MNENKTNKTSLAAVIAIVTAVLALSIAMVSCSSQEESAVKETAVKEAAAVIDESEKTAANETDKNDDAVESDKVDTGGNTEENSEVKEQKTSKDEQKSTTSATKQSQTGKVKQTQPKGTQEQQTQPKETQDQQTQPKETQEQQTQPKKQVCYITIEGYCSGKEIALEGSDTAYSILRRSGAEVSGSGSYIKGINGKFEFAEGPTSGWMYSVNGTRPNVGCGSYSVKAGDVINWYYVTGF